MEKIFANGATHKRLISQIYEQLMQAQYKKKPKSLVFTYYLVTEICWNASENLQEVCSQDIVWGCRQLSLD